MVLWDFSAALAHAILTNSRVGKRETLYQARQQKSRRCGGDRENLIKKFMRRTRHLAVVLASLLAGGPAWAGGGYFLEGYGPFSMQMAGTSTAVGFDGFAGASNPGKLFEAGDRVDLGLQLFMPHRQIERTGAANPIFDIRSTSHHNLFLLPDAGFAHRINERFAWGLTVYGNGGLNTDYRDTTQVPGTNANPGKCGSQPANFYLGCGRIGLNLSQIIFAPILAWHFAPHHTLGIAPLIAYQRINIYGFQAFEAFSSRPDKVSNNGYDPAFGIGARIGWFGQVLPWLDAGAAYSTQIYSQRFSRYSGLIAEHGAFDIPANYSVGLAARPLPHLTVAVDVQRVEWHSIAALANAVPNSITDPAHKPFGSRHGSGFNWRNQNSYKIGFAYEFSPRLTARAGYNYGRRPYDSSIDSASLALFAPNPYHQIAAGFTWKLNAKNDIQFAYQDYILSHYQGPSATGTLGIGGVEHSSQGVNVVYLAWSWRMSATRE